jgi:hypothetical protein
MAAIYSNGGNRWNILGFNFTKRDALSSVYRISMGLIPWKIFFYHLENYTIFGFQVVKDKLLTRNQSLIHMLLPW